MRGATTGGELAGIARQGRVRLGLAALLRRLRLRRPRHATIVAYLALFIALGGGSYAVVRAPSRDGRISACFNSTTGSLRIVNLGARCPRGQRKLVWNVRGLRGLRGLPGATGPPGAHGAAGAPGAPGAPGTPFDANATLPSGQTLTGVFAVGGGLNQTMIATIQFSPQLPADLPAASVHYVAGSPTPDCPGQGQAARGHLCVYEAAKAPGVTFIGIFNTPNEAAGAHRRGADVDYTTPASSSQPAALAVRGSWAVTAP
jgi:hypothetical protein